LTRESLREIVSEHFGLRAIVFMVGAATAIFLLLTLVLVPESAHLSHWLVAIPPAVVFGLAFAVVLEALNKRRKQSAPATVRNEFLGRLSSWLLSTLGPYEMRVRAFDAVQGRRSERGALGDQDYEDIGSIVWYPASVVREWVEADRLLPQWRDAPREPSAGWLLNRVLAHWERMAAAGDAPRTPRGARSWEELADIPGDFDETVRHALDHVFSFTASEHAAIVAYRTRWGPSVDLETLSRSVCRVRIDKNADLLPTVQHILGLAFCEDEPLALTTRQLAVRTQLAGHYLLARETTEIIPRI
jgi:hypothetical protein